MLYAFGGRNFFSFRNDFAVDLRVKAQASEREIFIDTAEGQKANSVLGIFGANASGKTHLLQALGFIHWFIIHSAQSDPEEPLSKSGEMFFRFEPDPDEVTDLFVEFAIEKDHYRYELTFDPTRLIRECLKIKRLRWNTLLERRWDGVRYIFKQKSFGEGLVHAAQRQNASLISLALLLENPKARQLDQFFSKFYGNLDSGGRNSRLDPGVFALLTAADFLKENSAILIALENQIKNFDLGLGALRVEKLRVVDKEGLEKQQDFPFGIRYLKRKAYKIPLSLESRGTQASFVLLRHLLPILASGGVAFVDEIEAGLHSHMIPKIIDLFYSRRTNPKGAQLIFSCHADYLLSILEKYQIQLVSKDEAGISTTYRLDSMIGVRNVDDHYAKYHAGAYGGVPQF